MKLSIIISLIFIGGVFVTNTDSIPNNTPKHLSVDVDWESITTSEEVFSFQNRDTLISHTMRLLRNDAGLPLLYYADILTPVCIDGLCKPVYVEMYWDLFGQYAGYGEYPDKLLSKFDHDDFEEEDYVKLNDLLADSHSILGRRRLGQLYDISQERKVMIKFKGQEVDGVSGATKKEIKTAIVEGALYSCYTLWHLAYGEAALKIKDRLPKIYNDALRDQFLSSTHDAYQMYGVEHLEKSEFKNQINNLTQILKTCRPITRKYTLKKMPKELFGEALMVDRLYSNISDIDFNARTLLINNLRHSNVNAALALSTQLDVMSKNQLKNYLDQVNEIPKFQTPDILSNLERSTSQQNFAYAFMVKEFLTSELN